MFTWDLAKSNADVSPENGHLTTNIAWSTFGYGEINNPK